MKSTYNRPPDMGRNEMNDRILRRILTAGAIFLILNIIVFLPPVQKKIESLLFSNIYTAGTLENKGIEPESAADDEVITKRLGTCVVSVEQQNRQGKGVIWDMNEQETLLVTAAHVAENTEQKVLITFYDGKQVFADVVYTAENADVAFLSVPADGMAQTEWVRYSYVRRNGQAEEALAVQALLISPQDGETVIRATVLNSLLYMEDFAQNMIWAEATATAGMSGSGMFDDNGNFMGILCGGNEQNEIAVLPAGTIWEEYEKSGRSRTDRMTVDN